jgi:nicotinamidase-related amidase
MTTLENRPNTALLVVDVQNGVVAGAHERDAVVPNVGRLVEKARGNGSPLSGSSTLTSSLRGGATTGGSSPS